MEPLPPVKEVEYRCIVGRIFEELSGMEYITFAFETAKEFSSFRYEIAVRYRIQPGSLEFKVLGMTATRTMMPAFGTARSVLKVPMLQPGVYNVKMIKSDGTENVFMLEVSKRGFQIVAPVPRKRFLDLVIDNKAAAPGAKITSTVSKTPPPPLIPRTIQKRQPPPPTPEELAILESLKSETPEERDAREEMELFGGKKKVDKKDLEEVEADLKKLGDGEAQKAAAQKAATQKAGAQKPIEEVREVPANAKTSKPAQEKAKEDHKASSKVEGKASEEPKAKAAAKPAPAKPAAKAQHAAKAPAKPAAKSGSKPTRTAATTVKHVAAKAKAAPAKPASKPAAKKPAAKPAVKSAPARTGSSKTTKHAATAKKSAPAKKR